MKRHAITLAVFAAAVLCFAFGWNDGGAALLTAGSVLELVFWSRVLRRSKFPSGGRSAG